MSRFADPTQTKTINLGDCACPGKPHPNDWIEVQAEFGGKVVAACNAAGSAVAAEAGSPGGFSLDAASAELVAQIGRRWNLQLPGGAEAPLDRERIALLDVETLRHISREMDAEYGRAVKRLPNARGGRSRRTS